MVNLDNISYIEDSHGKKAVILSMESYKELVDQIEELEDIKSYISSKNTSDEKLPFSLVEELILGEESKIKIMRKYRGYSVTKLAEKCSITESYLSQIENGKRKGTIDVYKRIAKELDIDIELIL